LNSSFLGLSVYAFGFAYFYSIFYHGGNMNSGTQTARSEPQSDTNLDTANGRSGQMQPDRGNSDSYVELKYRSVENLSSGKFAAGLGVFSFALGLAEILAPGQVGSMMGLGPKHRAYLPALGARELAHGIAIFSSSKPTAGVWSRVGGDIVDLAFLGSAFSAKGSNKKRLTGATVAILGATALDLMCAMQLNAHNWKTEGNPMAPTTVGQSSGRQSFTT
jgi:hypothetical protein